MTAPSDRQSGLESPPAHIFPLPPDVEPPRPTRGLMVAGAGDVALVTLGGETAILPALVPGVQYAIRATRILSTGTTATGIVGLA